MSSLAITIKPASKRPRKILIEMDANKFEKLAGNFGFFNPDFIKSLDRAERDYKAGKVKKIKSLRELRK
jgi:hypothetical protein